MYNPIDAEKSYTTLLKERGANAALQGAIFVTVCFLFDVWLLEKEASIQSYMPWFFLCCIYYTFKPKLIRFLKGLLSGKIFKDKSD